MRRATAIFACTAIFAATAGPCGAETWKVTSLDWQPYSGSDIDDGGHSVQKLREVLARAGIELEIEFYPWARAQRLASTEEYVGYFPAWPEEVYEGFVGSDAVDYSYVGVLSHRRSGVEWSGLEELFQSHKVGYVRTYTYPEVFETLKAQYPQAVDPAPDELSLMRKLSRGRNDVALTDPQVMLYTAEKDDVFNIEVLHKNIERKALVLSFRQGEDNEARIDLLNRLLRQYPVAEQ